MNKRCLRTPAVLLVICLTVSVGARHGHSQKQASKPTERKGESFAPGLAGVYFNSEDFKRPDNELDVLLGVDHDWGKERGTDWSARWGGFITGPCDGVVTITAEATDGLRLRINDVIVIDGLEEDGPRVGEIEMTRGEKSPIVLGFTSGQGR
ncbi:MAG: PA14 domain-containing protein, partial [Planctomycetota bacterium]